MTDVNSSADSNTSEANRRVDDTDLDVMHLALIELLFFAYRDFTSEPDTVLQAYGFGRAHHRVLHFVHRKPGLSVAELLKILKITKQSLARVLKQLITDGFIEQEAGVADRRQRLLYATEKGQDLALELAQRQSQRIRLALEQAGPRANEIVSTFLLTMVAPQNRASVVELIGKTNLSREVVDIDDILKEWFHAKYSNTQY